MCRHYNTVRSYLTLETYMWVKDGYEKIVIQIVYNIYKTQPVDTEKCIELNFCLPKLYQLHFMIPIEYAAIQIDIEIRYAK